MDSKQLRQLTDPNFKKEKAILRQNILDAKIAFNLEFKSDFEAIEKLSKKATNQIKEKLNELLTELENL